MNEIGRGRPAARMRIGGGDVDGDGMFEGRRRGSVGGGSGGQFPDQLSDAARFGAGWDPVRGTGSEGEPIGFGSPDDDVMDDVLQLTKQWIWRRG